MPQRSPSLTLQVSSAMCLRSGYSGCLTTFQGSSFYFQIGLIGTFSLIESLVSLLEGYFHSDYFSTYSYSEGCVKVESVKVPFTKW